MSLFPSRHRFARIVLSLFAVYAVCVSPLAAQPKNYAGAPKGKTRIYYAADELD